MTEFAALYMTEYAAFLLTVHIYSFE